METKFTPGPWALKDMGYLDSWQITSADGFEIGIVINRWRKKSINEANARLIAKSPVMYEFIQRVADGQHGELKGEFIANIRREAKEIIQEVIAKAIGEKEEEI